MGQIIVVAGRRNFAALKDIGATHVIDREAPDVLEQIRGITGDDLIYAVDTVNVGGKQGLAVAALSNKKKGTLITLLPVGGELDASRTGAKSAGYSRRVVFGVSPIHPEVTIGFWEELPGWLRAKKIRPSSFEIINGLDADAVNTALDHYRDGNGTRVNIHPFPVKGSL